MLRVVYNYQISKKIYCLTGCSTSSGRSGTSNDPNKNTDTGACESLSKNSANENKDPNYCGYLH